MIRELDRRGNALVIGATVAFNYSGQIDIGKITESKYSKTRKRYNGGSTFTYAVDYKVQSITRPFDPPSKVRNRESMLVVKE